MSLRSIIVACLTVGALGAAHAQESVITLDDDGISIGTIRTLEPTRAGCWSNGLSELCVTADECEKVIAREGVASTDAPDLERRVAEIEAQMANPYRKTVAHDLISRIESLEERLEQATREWRIFGAQDMSRLDQKVAGLIIDLRQLGIPINWRSE